MDTQDTQFPRSRTLENIGISPKTVCATCPNAVWYAQANNPQVPIAFCKIFHSIMDMRLTECDGNPNIPARLDLPRLTPAEDVELTQEQFIAGMPNQDTPPTID